MLDAFGYHKIYLKMVSAFRGNLWGCHCQPNSLSPVQQKACLVLEGSWFLITVTQKIRMTLLVLYSLGCEPLWACQWKVQVEVGIPELKHLAGDWNSSAICMILIRQYKSSGHQNLITAIVTLAPSWAFQGPLNHLEFWRGSPGFDALYVASSISGPSNLVESIPETCQVKGPGQVSTEIDGFNSCRRCQMVPPDKVSDCCSR